MKRVFALIASALIAASVTACASGTPPAESSLPETAASETETAAETEAAAETETQAVDQMSAAIGTWIIEFNGEQYEQIIAGRNEAYLGMTLDVTRDFYFDKDRNIICNGKTFTADDYSFENGVFLLSKNGKSIIEMEKTEAPGELLGEYRLTGGEYMDMFSKEESGLDLVEGSIIITASEGKTLFYALQVLGGFELKEDTIVVLIDGDGMKETPYRIEGDTMILTQREGEEVVLTRKK